MSASSATTSFQSRLTNLSLTKIETQKSASSLRSQALSVQKHTQVSSLISLLGKAASTSSAVQQLTPAVDKDNSSGIASKTVGNSGANAATASQKPAPKTASSAT